MTCLIPRKKYMRTVVTEDTLANYNLAKSLKAKCAPGIELITRIETSAGSGLSVPAGAAARAAFFSQHIATINPFPSTEK